MEWTAENNKETINGLLDYYADLLAVYRDFVDQNLDAELPTKLKALQTLKSLATTIDTLLKRWSFRFFDARCNLFVSLFSGEGTVVYGVHSGVRCCLGKSPSRLFVFDVVDYFQGRSRCHADAFARVSRPTEK